LYYCQSDIVICTISKILNFLALLTWIEYTELIVKWNHFVDLGKTGMKTSILDLISLSRIPKSRNKITSVLFRLVFANYSSILKSLWKEESFITWFKLKKLTILFCNFWYKPIRSSTLTPIIWIPRNIIITLQSETGWN